MLKPIVVKPANPKKGKTKMTISAALVKELRKTTGAGILDCRNALDTSNGDIEKAILLLREKGLADAKKRSGRETRNGVVDLYSHGEGRIAVMVEVNCETDFVARTKEFRGFAHEIALQIAAAAPRWIRVEDVPPDISENEREKSRKLAQEEGKPENIIERIVEGRLSKFFDENCLLCQEYVRDDSKRVNQILKEMIASTGENITIRRFKRWTVGEEIE
jgi:elongation factor Ts